MSFAETGGEVIMKDTFYGAVTGAIIGLALLAFQDDPEDNHLFLLMRIFENFEYLMMLPITTGIAESQCPFTGGDELQTPAIG